MAGRPRIYPERTDRLVRFPSDQLHEIKQAANLAKKSFNQYVIDAAYSVAQKQLVLARAKRQKNAS